MAYVRPAMPLEINPAASVMTDAMVVAFGSSGTSLSSFGRVARTGIAVGNVTIEADSVTIQQNSLHDRVEFEAEASMNSEVFTRVIVFDLPVASPFPLRIMTTDMTETGSGYTTGSLTFTVHPDGAFGLLRENEAEIIIGAAGAFSVGTNTVVITRRADTTTALSINGGAVMNGAASPFRFGWTGFGTNDQRDHDNGMVRLRWYAQSPSSVTDQQLIDLSNNPTMMTRTSGTAGADTTPPVVNSHSTNTAGTQLTLNMSEVIEGFSSFTAGMFTLTGSHTVTGATFSGSNAVAVIDPPLAPGETVAFSFVPPASPFGMYDAAGNAVAAFTINPVSNSAQPPTQAPNGKPIVPGYILMTLGDKAGTQPWADFANEAEMTAWVNGTDVRNLASPVLIWNYLDRVLDFSNVQTGPIGSDRNKYITFKPAPGRAFWELEPENADGSWGTLGDIIRSTNTTSWLTGIKFEGFKVHIPANAVGEPWRLRRNGWDQTGSESGMSRCKFLNESTLQTFATGEYGNYTMIEDCAFLETNPANTSKTCSTGGGGEAYRSTFYRANANNATVSLEGFNEIHSCVFHNYGADPYIGTGNRSNNYTNKPTTAPGATYEAQAMFESGIRPAAGTAIIGGGGAKAVSINDINGNNRGLNPDAGAVQRTPAMPLGRGTLTKYEVDGSSLLVAMSYENTVDSATISISPADSTSGAVSMGPFQMVINAAAKTIAYDVDDIVPGNYLCTVLLSNSGGANPVPGTSSFSIMGVGGGTEDPGTIGPATAVTLTGAVATATVGVATAAMRLGLNGARTGSVVVGVTDNDGGVFTPAAPEIINGEGVNFTYTPASSGAKTLVFTNGAGLVNPPNLAVNVAAAQLPAPTVAISTAQQGILMGSRATLSGGLDYKGDANGIIEIFINPLPSGTPVKFDGIVNVNGNTWTAQIPNLNVGEFKLRAKVTANGQTAEASTSNLRIVGSQGLVNVPVA